MGHRAEIERKNVALTCDPPQLCTDASEPDAKLSVPRNEPRSDVRPALPSMLLLSSIMKVTLPRRCSLVMLEPPPPLDRLPSFVLRDGRKADLGGENGGDIGGSSTGACIGAFFRSDASFIVVSMGRWEIELSMGR